MDLKLLTTRDVSERYGVDIDTVIGWCKRGLFPNMLYGPKTGRGKTYLIPETDLNGFVPPARGRPQDSDPSPAALAKRRSRMRLNQVDEEA